jgi:hypothetical protein
MEAVRARWTDDRIDDLRRDVDARFDKVERRFERVETRLDGIQESIVDLHGTVARFAMMLVVALIGLSATQLGLILAQL